MRHQAKASDSHRVRTPVCRDGICIFHYLSVFYAVTGDQKVSQLERKFSLSCFMAPFSITSPEMLMRFSTKSVVQLRG